jgi:hypothetical protein
LSACQTLIVAFQYDAFWSVTGGAAPVIALAAVVLLGQLNDQAAAMSVEAKEIIVRDGLGPARELDQVRWQEFDRVRWEEAAHVSQVSWFMFGLIVAQGVNLLIQCVLLAVSLVSLATHRNFTAPALVTTGEVVGIALLAVCTIGMSAARQTSRNIVRRLKDAWKLYTDGAPGLGAARLEDGC